MYYVCDITILQDHYFFCYIKNNDDLQFSWKKKEKETSNKSSETSASSNFEKILWESEKERQRKNTITCGSGFTWCERVVGLKEF
jgi:hypothetical protein